MHSIPVFSTSTFIIFAEDDVVIDQKEFPDIVIGDILEIYHPDAPDRLVLLCFFSFNFIQGQSFDFLNAQRYGCNLH